MAQADSAKSAVSAALAFLQDHTSGEQLRRELDMQLPPGSPGDKDQAALRRAMEQVPAWPRSALLHSMSGLYSDGLQYGFCHSSSRRVIDLDLQLPSGSPGHKDQAALRRAMEQVPAWPQICISNQDHACPIQ